MASYFSKTFLALSVAFLLSLPQLSLAAQSSNSGVVEEKPTALAMTGDLIIARPALLGITIVGTVVFLVSAPFSLMGGNFKESARVLVGKPAQATFVRCLGCTNPGYKNEVREEDVESTDK